MFSVEFTPNAKNDLNKLDKKLAQRILNKILWLTEKFDILAPKPLSSNWKNVYKLRVGNYRVLYTYNKETNKILIHFIKHRREIYKEK